MLINRMIEFELRWPGPPGRLCTPTIEYFYDKQKSLQKIFEWITIYC